LPRINGESWFGSVNTTWKYGTLGKSTADEKKERTRRHEANAFIESLQACVAFAPAGAASPRTSPKNLIARAHDTPIRHSADKRRSADSAEKCHSAQ
jgi:hypothetical protein